MTSVSNRSSSRDRVSQLVQSISTAKISYSPDVVEGTDGGVREQTAQIRNSKFAVPMSRRSRLKKGLFASRYVSKSEILKGAELEEEEETNEGRAPSINLMAPQFRLKAKKITKGPSIFSAKSMTESLDHRSCFGCCNINEAVANYLHWSFRSSFFMLFLSFFLVFFLWVIIFAGFIYWYGSEEPPCVSVGGEPFVGDGAERFYDAFTLSWTTFSTVGYGVVYPQTGSDHYTRTCFGLQFISSLEAFVGVLYAGFCGAVLYGKVSRIQSVAQVYFSDPIVIRYGEGVDINSDGRMSLMEEDNESEPATHHPSRIPCPILEFRIINRQSAVPGGEIIDGSLNCVVGIQSKQADPAIQKSVDPHRPEVRRERGSRILLYRKSISTEASNSTNTTDTVTKDEGTVIGAGLNQAIDEDSSNLVPRRIFAKMNIETDQLPFFKRVWVARHVLDETSPLLTHKARHQVKKNKGHWPEKLNNHEAVRNSIRFQQIIVSLSGTSNINAADVYAQKVYDFFDINVGYQFANVLFRKDDGSLNVDTEVINDILEQNGGGAEPFLDRTGSGVISERV